MASQSSKGSKEGKQTSTKKSKNNQSSPSFSHPPLALPLTLPGPIYSKTHPAEGGYRKRQVKRRKIVLDRGNIQLSLSRPPHGNEKINVYVQQHSQEVVIKKKKKKGRQKMRLVFNVKSMYIYIMCIYVKLYLSVHRGLFTCSTVSFQIFIVLCKYFCVLYNTYIHFSQALFSSYYPSIHL